MAIIKAGAIILSARDQNKVLLLFRGKENDWSFPKGHVELGEGIEEGMKREVLEETGLVLRKIRQLPDMEYKNSEGKDIRVYMFFGVSADDDSLRAEFEGDRLIWKDLQEVGEILSYENLKEYFLKVQNILTE